jgi:hypothetical protein
MIAVRVSRASSKPTGISISSSKSTVPGVGRVIRNVTYVRDVWPWSSSVVFLGPDDGARTTPMSSHPHVVPGTVFASVDGTAPEIHPETVVSTADAWVRTSNR